MFFLSLHLVSAQVGEREGNYNGSGHLFEDVVQIESL